MANIQTIYQETILPLPNSEKLRLAAIILQDLSKGESKKQSAFDLLQNLPDNRVFSDSKAADKHLKAERESWDN